MFPPRHTPYDGSARPFTIGLKPLALADWIEIDDDFARYQAEKRRLWQTDRRTVFAERDDSRPAQLEVLELLKSHLPERFPNTFRRDREFMRIADGDDVDLHDPALPPLQRAALLVQDDLVVMAHHDDEWRLAAASLAFPSSWSLAEKFDRPMAAIHAEVPAFGPGTRNAALIERMFDNLKTERPVWRLNWSIYPDADLHHPKDKASRPPDFVKSGDPSATFIRVEKQTLRRLPESGAILFTIRIYVDPISAIMAHDPDGKLAAGLKAQLEALDEDERAYKGLSQRVAGLAKLLASHGIA